MPEQTAPEQTPRTPQPAEGVHVARPQTVETKPVATTAVAAEPAPAATGLILSASIVTRSDVSKTLREIKTLDDYFHQAAIRGSKDQELPSLSRQLDKLAQANSVNLLHAEDRQKLAEFMARVKAKAPVIHMSFPSEAGDAFIAKLLEWFRANVHEYAVLHIGLQPELAAGCVVRTTNKLFDFSFRKRFEKSKEKLLVAIREMGEAPEMTKIADANATNQPTAMTAATPTPPSTSQPATETPAVPAAPAATEPVASTTEPSTTVVAQTPPVAPAGGAAS